MQSTIDLHTLALAVAMLMAIATSTSHATNGYQLIGVGAYQKSLAGAVTAKPGSDMTAISNPAGLAVIADRADFSMEAFMPSRNTDFRPLGGEKVDSNSETYGIPALGWKARISEDSNIYFGGGMYGTSGLGVDYKQTLMNPAMPTPGGPTSAYWDGYSSIAFWQMAPAMAVKASNKLSWGVAMNLDYQSVSFTQRVQVDTLPGQKQTVANFDLGNNAQEFGVGMDLGLLYDITDNLTVGVNYKTKQYFDDLEYNLAYGDIQNPTAIGAPLIGPNGEFPSGRYKMDLDYPQQAAVGLAYSATESFTVSADVKWIDWSDTMDTIDINGPSGIKIPFEAGWDDQWVYAIGIEYAVNPRLNLRAGFNYAEAPIDDKDVSNNLILPAIVEQHYTIGGDYQLNKHWELGFHFMYVPQETLTADGGDFDGAKISMDQTSVGINLGYEF